MIRRFSFILFCVLPISFLFAQTTPISSPDFSSQKRIVKVALLQQPAWKEGKTPEEIRQWQMNWILKHLDDAGKAHADIVCMGESTVEPEGLSLPENPTVDAVREKAKVYKMYVIFPVIATRDGKLHNTAVMINRDGSISGYYDKVHPTETETQKGIIPGDDIPVFPLDFGVVSVVICHDLSFVESCRVAMLKGAELVFWPTWWSGWGQELDWIVIRSRAIDNDLYLAVVSRGVKPETGWKPGDPIGHTGIIDPYGQTISNAGFKPGMILTEIDLNQKRIAPSFSSGKPGERFRDSILKDRNPKAYRVISQ